MMHSALKLIALNRKPVITRLTASPLHTLSPRIDVDTVMGLVLIV